MEIPYFCDPAAWDSFRVELFSWMGTPYRHFQRTKGYGADCTMFVGQVYVDMGILSGLTYDYYSRDWHLHTNETIVEDSILENFNKNVVDKSLSFKRVLRCDEDWVRGDFLLIAMVNVNIANHMAILLESGDKMIHAHQRKGVVEDFYTSPWRRRTKYKVRIFREV